VDVRIGRVRSGWRAEEVDLDGCIRVFWLHTEHEA
jgi:hypothetical protein